MTDTIPHTTITLGNIPLNIFVQADGTSYGIPHTEAIAAVDGDMECFKEFWKKFWSMQSLNEKMTLLSINEVIAYWAHEFQNGNTKAMEILIACAKESIQRRADNAQHQGVAK